MAEYVVPILIVIAIIIVMRNIKVVPQAQAFILERLGAYKETWEVGLHFKVPLIDKISNRVSN